MSWKILDKLEAGFLISGAASLQMGNLTFKEVDHAKYPAVDLAYSAGRSGGTMTGVLSAANEKVICYFLHVIARSKILVLSDAQN